MLTLRTNRLPRYLGVSVHILDKIEGVAEKQSGLVKIQSLSTLMLEDKKVRLPLNCYNILERQLNLVYITISRLCSM